MSDVKKSEIRIHNDAPGELREVLPVIAADVGFSPKPLRRLVCQVLFVAPNRNNWSESPNIEDEVSELLGDCEWYKIYDIIESIYNDLSNRGLGDKAEKFSCNINKFFLQNGIGWQLVDGQVISRGPEAFEAAVVSASKTLEESGRVTASLEIHEALLDLSRRPKPDLTGALHHAMASLECVARDVTGNQKATLGELTKKHFALFPPPLDQAVEKAWGYASDRGRHLREGHEPEIEEVELVVGLASVLATYLSKK